MLCVDATDSSIKDQPVITLKALTNDIININLIKLAHVLVLDILSEQSGVKLEL